MKDEIEKLKIERRNKELKEKENYIKLNY